MPITSPSYFPPSRAGGSVVGITAGRNTTGIGLFLGGQSAGDNSTASNLVIIGDNSGKGGIPTDLSGTVIIGAQSLQALATWGGLSPPALTVVGHNNLPLLTTGSSTISIGDGVLTSYVSTIDKCVFIGNGLGTNLGGVGAGTVDNVAIGYNCFSGMPGNNGGHVNNVIIGSSALNSITGSVTSNVIIGQLAGNAMTLGSNNIIIGQSATSSGNGGSNVIIGTGSLQVNINDQCVMIGANQTTLCSNQVGQHISIGFQATLSSGAANVRSISIGSNAGRSLAAGLTNILVIETNDAADAQHAFAYSDLLRGNIVLGGSVDGTNRDFGGVPGTNILKLINGTRSTGTAIAGGGYFYVSGGVVRWVSSGGIDTQLSRSVAGQLASQTLTAYTDNQAAQAGTLLNGPVAGNPTKWIPINDNGTIRNIPAW